jgi:hypothetical protein
MQHVRTSGAKGNTGGPAFGARGSLAEVSGWFAPAECCGTGLDSD